MLVAGVDGCRDGWVVVTLETATGALSATTVREFAVVLKLQPRLSIICVDTPVGLLGAAVGGGRDCDRDARALLGAVRGTSVFSAPVRGALSAATHAEASDINRKSSASNIGLSIQTFGIFRKIADVDSVITPALQRQVFEVHPELCFFEMNAGVPVVAAKMTKSGVAIRTTLLQKNGIVGFDALLGRQRPIGAQVDDVIDALAAAWTAWRIGAGRATAIPSDVVVDDRGVRMAIWR